MEKKRILLGVTSSGQQALYQILSNKYDLTCVYSLTEAKRFLSESTPEHFVLVLAEAEFDGRRMMDLLRFVRSQRRYDVLPFIVLDADGDNVCAPKLVNSQAIGALGALVFEEAPGDSSAQQLRSLIEQTTGTSKKFVQKQNDAVLLADPDPYVQQIASRFLNEAGYEVIVANDGYQALDEARKSLPVMILAELMLPRLDGLSLCRLIKADEATQHIVTVIVFSVIGAERRAKEAGADAFVKKPIDRIGLLNVVQDAVQTQRARA